MATDIVTSPNGEIINDTPLGTGEVNPKTGLDLGERKINVEKLNARRLGKEALYFGERTGEIPTGQVVPKSVYRILGDDYHPEFDPEYNAQLLSREQSNGGKFLSALNQAVVGQVAGASIQGFGYLLDLPMMADLVEGTEQEFGNAFTKIGENMQTWSEEATPIFTDPKAPKFNPSSFEWWMKNLPSVASTAGLVFPSIAGMSALKGVAGLVGMTEKFGELGKFSKLFTTSLGQAIMSRHMENLMESKGVYDQGLGDAKNALYEKYADQIDRDVKSLPTFTPVDPERGPQPGQYTKEQYDADLKDIKNKWDYKISQEATKVAAIGAANTYNKQWVMLLQDLPEYMLLNRFMNKGLKSIAANTEEKSAAVAKHLGMNMPKFYTSAALKQAANAAGEGGEEFFQFINEQQSSEMIKNLADPDKKTSFSDQVSKNWSNGDLWTNTFWGAMGAGFMQATMAGINSKAMSDSGKARVKQLTELSPLINKLHADYVAAEADGDEIGMEAAKKGFVAAVGIKSKQFGNKEHLLNMVNALAEDDQNVLTNYEIDPEARKFFKGKNEIAQELKDDIETISKRYDDAIAEGKKKGLSDKQNTHIAASIAHSNYMLEYLNKKLAEEKTNLQSIEVEGYSKPNPAGEQLSDKGKQAFAVAYQKRDLTKRLAATIKQLSKEGITKEDKEKYEKQKTRLESKIELANEIITELGKDDTLTKEQKAIDAKLHGDLTKEEPNGIIPIDDVLNFIDTQKRVNSYDESVSYFKDQLDDARVIIDRMVAYNKKQTTTTTTKPKEPVQPPVEDKDDLDVGHIVTYQSTDGEEKRGIVQDIVYAVQDTEGNSVEPSSENVDNIITIQPIDEKNNKVGDLDHVSGATVIKEAPEVQEQPDEGIAEEDITDIEDILPPEGPDKGDNIKDQNRRKTNDVNKGLIEFLSYAEYEETTPENQGKLKKLIVRNKALDEFLSNPANQEYLSKGVARYTLDLKNEFFKAKLDKARKEKRMPSYLLDSLDEYINKGKKLKSEDIDKLLTYADFFGEAAITVELSINGKTFKGGLFVHTLSKTASRLKDQPTLKIYAQMRKSLVEHLLNGDKVYTVGLSTNRGNPNNIDKTNSPKARKNDVLKTFGFKDYKDVELFVLKSSTKSSKAKSYEHPTLHRDNESIESIQFDFSSTGSVFVKTDKTINGQPFAVKLNKSFVSEDHAFIIFNAFSTLAKTELVDDRKYNNGKYSGKIKPPQKKGRIGQYAVPIDPHAKDQKESVAWNISAGELLDLLVVHGEELTDPNSARYKYVNALGKMSEEHRTALENKRLFLQRGYNSEGVVDGIYLCYGKTIPYSINTNTKGNLKEVNYNRINLTSQRASGKEADAYMNAIRQFTDWIQSNKTYAVHLENKMLGLKLNGTFLQGKNFRIGKKGFVAHPTDLPSKRYVYNVNDEIVRNPGESYVEFLLKNGFVTTDMEEKNGSLFSTPFMHLGVNQNYKQDFGLRVGDAPYTEAPISSNLENVEEIQNEETKDSLKTEPEKKVTKGKRKRKKEEISKDGTTESTGEDMSVRQIMDDDNFLKLRQRPPNTKVYDVQDLEKELSWIRKTLNIEPDEIKIERDLAKMLLGGKEAWGVFSSAGITIYEAAEKGTIYHEAFHKVNLAYHTKEEREAIYRSARLLYSMPKESFTDNQVEEKIAEEFREFVISKQTAPQPSFIKRVFQGMYNFIRALFYRAGSRLVQSDIDRLFNQIYSGKYRFAKVLTENKKIEPRLRSILGENFDTIQTYKDITTFTKYLAKKLMRSNNVTNLNDVRNITYQALINDLNKTVDRLEARISKPDVSESERNEGIKLIATIKDALGEPDENGFYPKFTTWVKYVDRFLGNSGIVHRESSESQDGIWDQETRYSELSDEESGESSNENYNTPDYFRPSKDTALASVKFVINTLHESDEVSNTIAMVPFADGNKVWYKLLNDIIQYDDVVDMVNQIRSLGEENDYYPYIELADILDNASESFRTQFQSAFEMYKHRHLVVQFQSHREGDITMTFDSSGHAELARTTVLRWNETIQNDRNIVQLISEKNKGSVTREKVINQEFFDSLVEDYENDVLDWYKEKTDNGKVELSEKDLATLFKKVSKTLSKIHVDIDVDVLRHFAYDINRTRSLQNNLYTFLNSIYELLGPEIIMDNKGNPTNYMKNQTMRSLGESYADVNAYEESDMTVGPEGNMIWKYAKLNLATDNLRRIKRSEKWAADKISRIGNKHSRLLKSFVALNDTPEEIARAKSARDAFNLFTMSNFKRQGRRDKSSRDYLHLNVYEDYLFKAYAILNNAALPFPVMANRRTYFMMEGVDLVGIQDKDGNNLNVIQSSNDQGNVVFTDEVINMFYDYYLDEKERIEAAIKTRKEYEEQYKLHKDDEAKVRELRNKLIRNYHYAGNGFSKGNFDRGNAYHFIHFKGFEKYKTPEQVKAALQEVLNARLKGELDFVTNEGIIQRIVDPTTGKVNLNTKLLSNAIINGNQDIEQPDNFGMLSVLSKIMVNTQMGILESEKLFLGDIALFKRNDPSDESNYDTYAELYKRWSGVGSTGTRLRVKYPGKSTTYNVSTLNTQKFESIFHKPMVEKHTELYETLLLNKLTEEERKDPVKIKKAKKDAKDLATTRLTKYENVDPTDGTAIISPEMFKEVTERMGLWDDRKEKAFNLLNSDKILSAADIIKASNIVFNPLKTVYIGSHNFNDIDLLIYNKMAMFTLFRQHVKGTHLEKVLDRMELKGEYAGKSLEKIHVYNFDSAVKTGGLNGMNLFTNSKTRDQINDLGQSFVFQQNFDNLKHQQVVDVHDSMKQNFGTAGFKIATADISKTEHYGEHGTGEQLLTDLHKLRSTLSNFGLHNIDAKFGISNGKISNKVFIDMLRRDAEAANKAFDFINALATDDKGEKYLEIDSFNDRKWIYSRIKSIVDELTVTLNTPGNQLVQMTNYGMNKADYNEDLKFIRSNVGEHTVYSMECKVSIRLFKNFFPRGHQITESEAQELININPELFGYRVPTQGQNSLMKLKVVGLLPAQVGDIIQLPLEFTALTGSDFDIDKLFISMYNYEYYGGEDGDIKLRKISFLTGNTEEEQRDRYHNKTLELFDIYKYSLESFRDVLVDDNGKKVPIVSKYFNSKTEELSDIAKEYRENKKEYESEEYNLLIKVQSLEKKISESKNETYKKSLEYDLTDAKIKLDDIRTKLTNIPYEIELKKILNLTDMVSLQEHLVLSGKLPTFEDFIKLPIEEQNLNKAVQNQLLDKLLVILSDEKHFINMTTPLGIMNDKLEKKADDYDAIYKSNETKNVPALYTTTPSFQAAMKVKFASSTFGIAPYALNNNHHSLTQMADVVMKSDIDLGFNNKGEIDLSRVIGEDNMYITWWLSALIDAHVDGVNKPYITSLNVNESTHDILSLLIRAGLGEISFDFINQPIVRAYSDSFFKTNKNYGKDQNRISTIDESNPINHVLSIYNQVIEQAGLMTAEQLSSTNFIKDSLIPLPKLLNLNQLKADAKESKQATQSKEYYIRQLSILYHLGSKDGIKNDAKLLNNFVLASRVDTKKYGANPVEIIHFLNQIKNVMDSKRFKNIDKILTWDKNYTYKEGDTFLPTLIKNSMFKIYDILKNESIYATPGFNNIIDDLVDSTSGGTYNRLSTINIIMEELMTHFVGKFFSDPVNGMGMKFDNIVNLLFERQGSIYNKLTTLKNGTNEAYKEFKDNPLINSLIVDYSDDVITNDEGEGIPYTYIKTPYWSKRDDIERDELVDGYKDLLSSPHSYLQSLGIALYVYSFYTSGFRQRINSFASSIPLSMNREFKYQNKILHFNEHMKRILNTLNSKDGYLELLAEAKREVFTNMWSTQGFAQEMAWNNDTMIGFDNKDGEPLGVKITLSKAELSKLNMGTNADRELVMKPYILMYESDTKSTLYEYIGFDRSDNSIYYVSATKKGFGSNGHGTKGLFLYEYGIKTEKGDERSILKYNNPTTERYTIEEKVNLMKESMEDKELENFVSVPLEKQIVKEKGVGLAENFYTDDSAAELRELQKEQEDKDKLLEQRQKLNRKAYSIRDYDEETAPKKQNEDLKADTNNKSTYEAPIYIDVDGSAKGKNGLGIGAYAEFGEKKYFLRASDEDIRSYLTRELGKRGYELPKEISNPTAELMALLTTLNAFRGTSEHLYIAQDYSTLMYFLKNAVNPEQVNETKLDYIQFKPDPNKPHMVFLIESIQNRINEIESNGGSVRIKYVPTKSTKGNKMADVLAKGDHPTIFKTRNDFRSEKWGKPTVLPNTIVDMTDINPEGVNRIARGETSKTINIYAGTGENIELSNFANRPFDMPYGRINNVESAFQLAKIGFASSDPINDRLITELMSGVTGAQAKALGRQVKNLNTKEWDNNSSRIMRELLLESFRQNPKALKLLLDTGNATLTHTQDKGKWGKEFPKLLMEVRKELSQNSTNVSKNDSKEADETNKNCK